MIENADFLTPELVAQLTEHEDLVFGKGNTALPWEALARIEVYVLTPENVSERDALAHAVMIGWQVLAEGEDGEAVAILVRDEPETGPSFEGTERGAQTDAVAHFLKTPPDLEGGVAAEVMPRLLSVPGIGLRALWYPKGDEGHVIPLAPSCRPFEPSRAISRAKFEEQLHPVAHTMVELHTQLGTGDK